MPEEGWMAHRTNCRTNFNDAEDNIPKKNNEINNKNILNTHSFALVVIFVLVLEYATKTCLIIKLYSKILRTYKSHIYIRTCTHTHTHIYIYINKK